MAKEMELTAKTYEQIRVTPAGVKLSGEMQLNQKTYGFYLTAFTAAMLALTEDATFITKAESVKVVKAAGSVWVAGDPVFWIEASDHFTNVDDGSGYLVGKATEAATSPAVIGYVNLRDYYPTQRGMQIGTSGVPYKIAASDPILSAFATSIATAGIVRAAEINLVPTVATSAILEALMVNITSAIRTGSWANAITGRIDYGTAGDAAGGMAASICAEMNLPGKATPGGALYCFDAEMNARANGTVVPGHTVAFMKFGLWGDATAITSFITNGYFLDIQGVASVTDGFFEEITVTAAQVFDACLRIKVGSANYFIGLCDDKSFA